MPLPRYQPDLLNNLPPSLTSKAIILPLIEQALSLYPSCISPDLEILDHERYEIFPTAIQQRAKAGKAYITADELVELVTWKLKHGTFRPRLLSLIKSNSAASVEETTSTAFALLPPAQNSNNTEHVLRALDILTELKGVGPATASLVLSCCKTESVPFFADELFRWVVDPASEIDGEVLCTRGKTVAKGTWDRGNGEIKYTRKEYAVMLRRAEEVRARLQSEGKGGDGVGEDGTGGKRRVSVADLEKVAFVLGRLPPSSILEHEEDAVEVSQNRPTTSNSEDRPENGQREVAVSKRKQPLNQSERRSKRTKRP